MYLQVHVIASLILCLLLFMAGSHGQSTDNSTSSSTISSTVSSTVSNTASTSSSMNSTAAAQNSTFSTVSSTAENASTSNTTNSTTFPDTTTVVATTTIITTTMKPSFDVVHNRDTGHYVLELKVGMDNLSDIQYTNASLTRDDLYKEIKARFPTFPITVIDLYATGQEFTLRVFYPLNIITNDSEQTFAVAIKGNIRQITQMQSQIFEVPNENSTLTKIDAFFSLFRNICAAIDVCPLGFICNNEGCQHMCATRDCSGHGTCFINVNSSASASVMCKCDDEYANEYTGDNCEYARRGRWQIIAILAAVLGTACLILIIIIIVMCVCYGRNKASANYNFSGASYHTNNAYDNSRDK